MPRNFSELKGLVMRDSQLGLRVILGVLLTANLVAAWAVFRPVGGSAEELDKQLAQMQKQIQQKRIALKRTEMISSKMDQARQAGDTFFNSYFMSRKTASSTILLELRKAAKDSGMKPKGDAFTFEPIEGSDLLSMMTISANYEGTYGDLLQFVNRLDKSQRFLILENMQAAPQQGSGLLNVLIRLNTFVREDVAQ